MKQTYIDRIEMEVIRMEQKLIIDGNAVYELDLKCVVKKEKEKKNKEVKKTQKKEK